MKTNLLILLTFFIIKLSTAQNSSYNFTALNIPYQKTIITDTCNDNRIIAGFCGTEAWGHSSYGTVGLPFLFKILMYENDSVGVSRLKLGSSSLDKDSFSFTINFGYHDGFRAQDRNHDNSATTQKNSISKVLSFVEGTAPYRVYVFEYQNTKISRSTSNLDSFNARIKLYEGSNVFEMHFGNSNISTPRSSIFRNGEPDGLTYGWYLTRTNFNGGGNLCIEVNNLTGSYENPTNKVTKNNCDNLAYMPLLPPTGTLYRFTPKTSLVKNQAYINDAFKVFPTITSNELSIVSKGNSKIEKIEILDLNGKIIFATISNSLEIVQDISEFENGMYFVNVYSKLGKSSYKIIKN